MSVIHLPYPRRTRRRLLLPPGLLALAWLLWLGCVAVPQLRGMKRQTVMQISIPPLIPLVDGLPLDSVIYFPRPSWLPFALGILLLSPEIRGGTILL